MAFLHSNPELQIWLIGTLIDACEVAVGRRAASGFGGTRPGP